MKKTKNKSEVSLSPKKSKTQCKETYNPPLDVLVVKVRSLRVSDEECRPYYWKITCFNQLLLPNVITSSKLNENINEKTIAKGYMKYDPSDYEKMSLFADRPLIAKRTMSPNQYEQFEIDACLKNHIQRALQKKNNQEDKFDNREEAGIDIENKYQPKEVFQTVTESFSEKTCLDCVKFNNHIGNDRRNENFSRLLLEELQFIQPCLRTKKCNFFVLL